jgi:hypothetical protein
MAMKQIFIRDDDENDAGSSRILHSDSLTLISYSILISDTWLVQTYRPQMRLLSVVDVDRAK